MNIIIILSWIFGIIAFLLFALSIQVKNKKSLLIMQLLANAFYGVQYLLLNAPTAGYMNFIAVVRCIIFYEYEKHNKKPSLLSLILLLISIVIVSLFTIDGYMALIPIGISVLYTISTWQNNMKVVRLSFLTAAIFWIIYNVYVGAYSSLIGNAFELASGIISLLRFKKED